MVVWAPEVGPTNDPIPLAPALGETLGESQLPQSGSRESEMLSGCGQKPFGLKSELQSELRPQILAGLGCRGSIT